MQQRVSAQPLITYKRPRENLSSGSGATLLPSTTEINLHILRESQGDHDVRQHLNTPSLLAPTCSPRPGRPLLVLTRAFSVPAPAAGREGCCPRTSRDMYPDRQTPQIVLQTPERSARSPDFSRESRSNILHAIPALSSCLWLLVPAELDTAWLPLGALWALSTSWGKTLRPRNPHSIGALVSGPQKQDRGGWVRV